MKHSLLSAAVFSALVPVQAFSAGMTSASAGRPQSPVNARGIVVGRSYQSPVYQPIGYQPTQYRPVGYQPVVNPQLAYFDESYDSWLAPAVERLVVGLQSRQLGLTANEFASLEATLQSKQGTRYQDALRQIRQARVMQSQGQHIPAASTMQVLLNSLRSSAATLRQAKAQYQQAGYGNQPGYTGQPSHGNQPGYTTTPSYGNQPGYGYQSGNGQLAGTNRPQRRRGRHLKRAIQSLRNGDIWGAREAIDTVAQRLGRRGASRPTVQRLQYLAQNLTPGNERWAIRQLRAMNAQIQAGIV